MFGCTNTCTNRRAFLLCPKVISRRSFSIVVSHKTSLGCVSPRSQVYLCKLNVSVCTGKPRNKARLCLLVVKRYFAFQSTQIVKIVKYHFNLHKHASFALQSTQIVKILNAHADTLNWIDRNSGRHMHHNSNPTCTDHCQ